MGPGVGCWLLLGLVEGLATGKRDDWGWRCFSGFDGGLVMSRGWYAGAFYRSVAYEKVMLYWPAA